MQAKSKAMKSNCTTAYCVRAGCARFHGAKKRPVEGEDLNALVTNAVKEIIKTNKRLNPKALNDSISKEG